MASLYSCFVKFFFSWFLSCFFEGMESHSIVEPQWWNLYQHVWSEPHIHLPSSEITLLKQYLAPWPYWPITAAVVIWYLVSFLSKWYRQYLHVFNLTSNSRTFPLWAPLTLAWPSVTFELLSKAPLLFLFPAETVLVNPQVMVSHLMYSRYRARNAFHFQNSINAADCYSEHIHAVQQLRFLSFTTLRPSFHWIPSTLSTHTFSSTS